MFFISPGVSRRWDAKGKQKDNLETVNVAALPRRSTGEKVSHAAALA